VILKELVVHPGGRASEGWTFARNALGKWAAKGAGGGVPCGGRDEPKIAVNFTGDITASVSYLSRKIVK
jgi:hypothetical protein